MKKIKNIKERITDDDVLIAYGKYRRYLLELGIYEEYHKDNRLSGLDKMNILKLASLYKKSGIVVKSKNELETRFGAFCSTMETIKQKNPEASLRDISTQDGRNIVSDAIYETQKDKRFKSADLEPVAIIENFALYVALEQVKENGKDKNSVLKQYEITEEEFKRAEESYKKYEQSGTAKIYDDMFRRNQGETPNKIVHYAAGALEIRPSEARRDLSAIQVLKGKGAKNRFKEDSCIVVYSFSQMVIDIIMRDPHLTPEEKNKKISELELAEYERALKNVEEANRKQNTNRYRIAREDGERGIG